MQALDFLKYLSGKYLNELILNHKTILSFCDYMISNFIHEIPDVFYVILDIWYSLYVILNLEL